MADATQNFCVFEGGGARGLAHLGTLQAIEKHKLNPIGYAGTSAGAIPAALAATGIDSTQMYDVGTKSSPLMNEVFGDKFHHPSEIFGPGRPLLWLLDRLFSQRWTKIFVAVVLTIVFSAIYLSLFYLAQAVISASSYFASMISLVSILLAVYICMSRFSGLVSLDTFISNFNAVLSFAVAKRTRTQYDATRIVTFGDIRDAFGISLRIVATDISEGRTAVFSTDDASTYHQCSVAKAVAASIAIPIIFKPVKIEGRHFCDGGLVSNLPAWTFEREAYVGPSLSTLSSEIIIDEAVLGASCQGMKYFSKLLHTGIFGSQELSFRGIQRHRRIRINAKSARLLQFDMPISIAKELIEEGFCAANEVISRDARERSVLGEMSNLIERNLTNLSTEDPRDSVRSFIVVREIDAGKHSSTLKISNWHGFQDDADHFIKFPFSEDSIFHNCFNCRQAVCIEIGDHKDLNGIFGARFDDGWIEKAYRKDRKMFLCWCLPDVDGLAAAFLMLRSRGRAAS